MCIVLKEESIKQKMVLFLISDRDCMICVTPSNEKTECCRQAIHTETCLIKWYETQEIHGLTHTCSLCRAQPTFDLPEDLPNRPVQNQESPNILWWRAAASCMYFRNSEWNEASAGNQDPVFLQFLIKGR